MGHQGNREGGVLRGSGATRGGGKAEPACRSGEERLRKPGLPAPPYSSCPDGAELLRDLISPCMLDNCYLSLGHQFALLHHVRHLRSQPGTQRHRQGMCDAQTRGMVGPQRSEVDVLADLAASVHLNGFSLEFWQL